LNCGIKLNQQTRYMSFICLLFPM